MKSYERRNTGRYTAREWRLMINWFGCACVKCGTVGKVSPDHIIPVSKGGSNKIENIQPLCQRCNLSKGNRERVDYRDELALTLFLQHLREM